MDTQEPQRLREKEEEEEEEDKAPPPPASSSASLSEEFSFTNSLHPPLNTAPNTLKSNRRTPTVAFDMAPADDLFFHGHLLPLHLVAPPRPSDFSAESFSHPNLNYLRDDVHKNSGENKERVKASSMTFSSFFGLGKPRKGGDGGEREEEKRRRRKRGFDMSRLLKKYTRVMEHLFLHKGEKKKRDQRRRPCTFSGHPNHREREWWRKKEQLSAPASMMASPRNSGLLSASAMAFSSPNDSSMEELQSAIQEAIAHCKKSVAMEEEKCKS